MELLIQSQTSAVQRLKSRKEQVMICSQQHNCFVEYTIQASVISSGFILELQMLWLQNNRFAIFDID